jgi:hypothetical protein
LWTAEEGLSTSAAGRQRLACSPGFPGKLESVGKSVRDLVGDSGPEFWWPQDRIWVVTTDHDLLSTYIRQVRT